MDQLVRHRRPLSKAERKEVTTRMPPELADAVRDAAQAQGATVNDYIVGLIEADLMGSVAERPVVQPQVVAKARLLVRRALAEALTEMPNELQHLLDDEEEAKQLTA